MHYSYKWLQELSGTDKSPEEVAELLMTHAFEVESLEKVGFDHETVVIGEVRALEAHPDADKLRVAQVNVGTETLLTIVCGAPNIALGQRVAVALVGTTLSGDMHIAERAVRGVMSQGMICSERELGLGEGHEGIWVLPESAKAGMLLRDFLGGIDTLMDIKVLPDRAHDCLSHVGMAREIAALEGRELDFDYTGLSIPFESWPREYAVSIEAEGKSARYIGASVRGVVVEESPMWLQTRLRTLGHRPINTVVDVTNYVMLELGQPLHAFDWARIAGHQQKDITVRQAHADEAITLLDGKDYALNETDLVIADAEKPLALAGIMGGASSAVTAETTEILLEAAHFDPLSIRRTRTRLGLRTDASDRFEKGLSPELPERALARALEILGHMMSITVETTQLYPAPQAAQEFAFHPESLERLLGRTYDYTQMAQTLRLLGFELWERETDWLIRVPAWRLDIDGVADLAEEVGRVLGYHLIPSQAPQVVLGGVSRTPERKIRRSIIDHLVALGVSEVYNYSFYSQDTLSRYHLEAATHLLLDNPMNADQACMRTTLIPGLIRNVSENLKHFDTVAVTECGQSYERDSAGAVIERALWAGAVTASDATSAFFRAKYLITSLAQRLGITLEWLPLEKAEAFWHPTQSARVLAVHGELRHTLGRVGTLHPSIRQASGLRSEGVAVWECSLAALIEALPAIVAYQAPSKFPTIRRDLALILPPTLTAEAVSACMRRVGGDLLMSVEAFDRYVQTDPETGSTTQSLAFHLIFGANDRTLASGEIDTLLQTLESQLQTELNVSIRK